MSDYQLDRINIFSDLSEKECELLRPLCKPRNYLKNSMIILEEEYGDLVFLVKVGTIKITRVNDEGKEVILDLLGTGDMLRKSDQQIEALSLSDAEHRIGVSLLNLAEDMGVIRKGKVTIQYLPFQQDIANMAGTSRETVSRVLKILENKNMISKEGHTLIIPDYGFFKQIFGKTF